MSNRRNIPAVEKVLHALGELSVPRPLVVQAVREEVAALRESDAEAPAFDDFVAHMERVLAKLAFSLTMSFSVSMAAPPIPGAILAVCLVAGSTSSTL